MNSKRFLIQLQYLGFRFHGVQKQSGFKSIQERIEQTLALKFNPDRFSTRFSSRTDAMVSSLDSALLLMFEEPQPLATVLSAMKRLPPDIKITAVKNVADNFSLLKNTGSKVYHYYFSHNQTPHVFAAPFMTVLSEELDIEQMKKGAKLFEGSHNFKNYCYKPKEGTSFERTIEWCSIESNSDLTASFFPEQSYVFKIRARGFLRGQVRLMMGALMRVGKNELTLQELQNSLVDSDPAFVKWMVPAAGLILKHTEYSLT